MLGLNAASIKKVIESECTKDEAAEVVMEAQQESYNLWQEYFTTLGVDLPMCSMVFFEKDQVLNLGVDTAGHFVFYINGNIYINLESLMDEIGKFKFSKENLNAILKTIIYHEFAHHVQNILFGASYGLIYENMSDYMMGLQAKRAKFSLMQQFSISTFMDLIGLNDQREGDVHPTSQQRKLFYEKGFDGGSLEEAVSRLAPF